MTPIVITLPDPVAAQVDAMAGKAGMSPGGWLSEQVAHAFGTGRVIAQDQPCRPGQSSRRRIAAAKRPARDAARASLPTETTDSETHELRD